MALALREKSLALLAKLSVIICLAGSLQRVSCQDATSDGRGEAGFYTPAKGPAPQSSFGASSPIFQIPSYLQTNGAQADNVVIEWNKVSLFSLVHFPLLQSLPGLPASKAVFLLISYITRCSAPSLLLCRLKACDSCLCSLQAIQYIIRNNNVTNIAPRLFAFVHLAMWQALRANNDTTRSSRAAPPVAVASMPFPY